MTIKATKKKKKELRYSYDNFMSVFIILCSLAIHFLRAELINEPKGVFYFQRLRQYSRDR